MPHILFPVGGLPKDKTRAIAERAGLSTAQKRDSQGLCFLGAIDVREFIAHYTGTKPGDVLDEKGVIVGSHIGAHLYTLGERHGFSLFLHAPDEAPRYIVAKDIVANTLTVSHSNNLREHVAQEKTLTLSDCNWFVDSTKLSKNITAQTRYHQKPQPCTVSIEGDATRVHLEHPESITALGQSCVLYEEDRILGGGIVAKVE